MSEEKALSPVNHKLELMKTVLGFVKKVKDYSCRDLQMVAELLDEELSALMVEKNLETVRELTHPTGAAKDGSLQLPTSPVSKPAVPGQPAVNINQQKS